MVVRKFFFEHEDGKEGEGKEGEDFLYDFELCDGEVFVADTVGGDLKAVFDQGDSPTGKDDHEDWFIFELEVTIPSKVHENV